MSQALLKIVAPRTVPSPRGADCAAAAVLSLANGLRWVRARASKRSSSRATA